MGASWLSRIVVAGVSIAATFGWMGVRLAPPPAQLAAPPAALASTAGQPAGVSEPAPGVRSRNAWQPSPMPAGQTQAVQPAQAAQPEPAARNRAAWQPSPIPAAPAKPAAPAAQPTPAAPALPAIGGAPVAALAGGPAVMAPGAAAGLPSANPAPATVAEPPGAVLLARNTVPSASAPPDSVDLGYIPMSRMFTADLLEDVFDGALPAQRGTWQIVDFTSKALGRKDSYMVWLPPGYGADQRRYPTLYLLHGVGGPNGFGVEEWLGYALTEDLDRMMALGLIQPMIVVLPNGEQGYWMNHADGGPKWADYVALDVVKDVDARFRTFPQRGQRAIGGLSMGGHGALQIALNHPDVFAAAGAHSPTLRSFEDSPEFFGDPKWFAKYDPLSLVRNTRAAKQLLTWIDVGSDDEEWRPRAQELAAEIQARGGHVEFSVLEGEHEGWYWEYYLPEYLNFYSSALGATAQTPDGAPVVASRPIGSAFVNIAKPATAPATVDAGSDNAAS